MRLLILRLRRTLEESQILLKEIYERKYTEEEDNNSLNYNNYQNKELLKRIRRLGFLLSSLKSQLTQYNDNNNKEKKEARSIIHDTELFISKFLLDNNNNNNIMIPCVGLLARKCFPKFPFTIHEPFIIHEDPICESVPVIISSCNYYRDESLLLSSSSFALSSIETKLNSYNNNKSSIKNSNTNKTNSSFSSLNETETMNEHLQIINDIQHTIKEMKEGAMRMSHFMQQEREQLNINSELLLRGVNGATIQSKFINTLNSTFGISGPTIPMFLNKIPGIEMCWNMMILPLWAIVKQTLFISIIIIVTMGTLFLMFIAPKTYAYAR